LTGEICEDKGLFLSRTFLDKITGEKMKAKIVLIVMMLLVFHFLTSYRVLEESKIARFFSGPPLQRY
jgi:hypothetical protein